MSDLTLQKVKELRAGYGWDFEHDKFMAAAPEIVDFLLAQLEELEKSIERLTDLVRYCRHDLHETDLITNEEYAAITMDSQNGERVMRLKGYDGMRKQLEEAQRQRDALITGLGIAIDDQQWMSGSKDFSEDGQAHKEWLNVRKRLFANMDLLREQKNEK